MTVGRLRPKTTPVDPDTSSPEDSEERRDWATTLVDRVVTAVESLRSVTTQPFITATRALVYGVLGASCLIGAVVLASIGTFRLLDLVLPGESWSAHLVLGGALCLLGAWLWSRRTH